MLRMEKKWVPNLFSVLKKCDEPIFEKLEFPPKTLSTLYVIHFDILWVTQNFFVFKSLHQGNDLINYHLRVLYSTGRYPNPPWLTVYLAAVVTQPEKVILVMFEYRRR